MEIPWLHDQTVKIPDTLDGLSTRSDNTMENNPVKPFKIKREEFL